MSFDIDGCIADSFAEYVRVAKADYGVTLDPEPSSYEDSLGGDDLWQLKAGYQTGSNTAIYEHCKPVPDALRYIQMLHCYGFAGAYVTSRPECLQELTEDWLKRHHFPELPVICTSDKAYTMWAIGSQFIVEDYDVNLRYILEGGLNGVLLKRSYNKHATDLWLKRDWHAIVQHVVGGHRHEEAPPLAVRFNHG